MRDITSDATAELELLGIEGGETKRVPSSDLVVIAELRDLIYPGMISTGKVERGGDKQFHTAINGENFHALKALTYTHRGKVDAIYIDPRATPAERSPKPLPCVHWRGLRLASHSIASNSRSPASQSARSPAQVADEL